MGQMIDHISDEQRQQLQKLADEQKHAAAVKAKADKTKPVTDLIVQQRRNRFRGCDNKVRFQLPDAENTLKRGLVWALGDDARWLPEYSKVAAWLGDNKGKGLLCMGDCGRGKTVITRDILPELFSNYFHLAYNYTTAKRLKECFVEFSHYKILCIDDVGTESKVRHYGNTTDYIEDIVDLCEQQDKLLICSTNLNTDQLLERYDLRVVDRLKALCRQVIFEGESMRG